MIDSDGGSSEQWPAQLSRVGSKRRARVAQMAEQLWDARVAALKHVGSMLRDEVAELNFTRDGAIVETVDGARFVFDPATCDSTSVGLLLRRGTYEREEWVALSAYLRPEGVVLDIGANIGWYAIRLAQAIGPQGQVVALEPGSEAYAGLQANVALNELSNVRCICAAAGPHTGTGVLFKDAGRGTRASLRKLLPTAEPTTCQVVTLDEVVGPHLDRVIIIKLDVEGAELPALRGATGILEDARPPVLLEYSREFAGHFGYGARDVVRFFHEAGYTVRQVAHATTTSTSEPHDEPFHDGSLLAVPDSPGTT